MFLLQHHDGSTTDRSIEGSGAAFVTIQSANFGHCALTPPLIISANFTDFDADVDVDVERKRKRKRKQKHIRWRVAPSDSDSDSDSELRSQNYQAFSRKAKLGNPESIRRVREYCKARNSVEMGKIIKVRDDVDQAIEKEYSSGAGWVLISLEGDIIIERAHQSCWGKRICIHLPPYGNTD
ncbi:hypothetical protein D9615_005832 [Tricholomella constricta]|uniref:Uncharacterized protein n=1 Tax=Tricholomella constricta TaxID=117010 RepID=A0A8H5HAM9_9AGAR|nr:hypothetical protein D9615_005832 [Tricholomella constricta]